MKLRTITVFMAYCFTPQPVIAYPPPSDPLVRIHYDMQVAGYCGQITTAVSVGFDSQLKTLVEQLDASKQSIQQARNKAIHAVHEEWSNRGLGGFRGWCKKEGVESAQRFVPD